MCVYSQLVQFLKDSEGLAEHDKDLKEEISHENVKLMLGKVLRLPNSLKRSMRHTFTNEPFENWTTKVQELMVKLESDAKSLSNLLSNMSNRWEEDDDQEDPFPFMRGIPSYSERCGHFDFDEVDHFSGPCELIPGTVSDYFCDYLDENKLSSLYDDPVEAKTEESSAESEDISIGNCSVDGSTKAKCQTPFESFSAKLRRIRGSIYHKIEIKNIAKADVDRYEALVRKFVKKFGKEELSSWEVSTWQQKVVKTRADAAAATFDEHLDLCQDFGDAHSIDLAHSSDDENDDIKIQNSADEIFAKQKTLENLLSNLPSVPNSEDEELEERLRRLRSCDEPDETREVKNVTAESPDDSTFVEKSMHHPQAKNEMSVEESKAKIPEVKDIICENSEKRNPADVLENRIETVVKETIPTSFDSDAFDAKQEFNDWFEKELRKKKKPRTNEVLAMGLAPVTEDFLMNVVSENREHNEVYDNREHKQNKSSDFSDFQQQDDRSPDLLIIMRACFILLLTMCKTLNDQSLRISKFSNPNFPVITKSPTESPLPTSNPLPCYVTKYERTHSCPCELFVSTVATVSVMMSSAGMAVTVWYRWTRDILQKCRDRVIIGIMSGSLTYSSENAIKSIEELKMRMVKK